MSFVHVLVVAVALLFSLVSALSSQPKTQTARVQQQLTTGIRALSSLVLPLIVTTSASQIARAKVYVDTDVYGDKELKIATVNKLKQKLRNAVVEDPSVATMFLKLALNDALGYDFSSTDGGPDGSVLFEVKRPENANLEKGVDALKAVKKDLQRTNSLSFADVCAFGGAEALESVGCSRITVQVGRVDAKEENTKKKVVNWAASPSSADIKEAFVSSGLGAKEIACLLGALGEVNRVVEELAASKKAQQEDEEEDSEFEDKTFVPTTFGKRDEIFGAKIGKGDFGSKYLSQVLKTKGNGNGGASPFDALLFEDTEIRAFVEKYAKNEVAFREDVPAAYAKLTTLGEAFMTRNS